MQTKSIAKNAVPTKRYVKPYDYRHGLAKRESGTTINGGKKVICFHSFGWAAESGGGKTRICFYSYGGVVFIHLKVPQFEPPEPIQLGNR
jgi:hypothetical protein